MGDSKEKAMARNPLQEDELLAETFFSNGEEEEDSSKRYTREKNKKEKPLHYKICCISLYMEDIARLDKMVKELKGRGYTKANKSQIIRYALSTVNLDKMPKSV